MDFVRAIINHVKHALLTIAAAMANYSPTDHVHLVQCGTMMGSGVHIKAAHAMVNIKIYLYLIFKV